MCAVAAEEDDGGSDNEVEDDKAAEGEAPLGLQVPVAAGPEPAAPPTAAATAGSAASVATPALLSGAKGGRKRQPPTTGPALEAHLEAFHSFLGDPINLARGRAAVVAEGTIRAAIGALRRFVGFVRALSNFESEAAGDKAFQLGLFVIVAYSQRIMLYASFLLRLKGLKPISVQKNIALIAKVRQQQERNQSHRRCCFALLSLLSCSCWSAKHAQRPRQWNDES